MRVIVDCNVVVSAAMGSPSCVAVLEAIEAAHLIILTGEIVAEYRRVSEYDKFSVGAKERMREIIANMITWAEQIPMPDPLPVVEYMADDKDVIYVIAAHVGRADALVTGNHRHFTAPSYGGARVVSAAEFLTMTGTA